MNEVLAQSRSTCSGAYSDDWKIGATLRAVTELAGGDTHSAPEHLTEVALVDEACARAPASMTDDCE